MYNRFDHVFGNVASSVTSFLEGEASVIGAASVVGAASVGGAAVDVDAVEVGAAVASNSFAWHRQYFEVPATKPVNGSL